MQKTEIYPKLLITCNNGKQYVTEIYNICEKFEILNDNSNIEL